VTEEEARRQVALGASRAVEERLGRARRVTPLLADRELPLLTGTRGSWSVPLQSEPPDAASTGDPAGPGERTEPGERTDSTGPGGGSTQQALASLLAFVRRRVTGDISVDDFGFDSEFTDTVLLTLLRPLYRTWFRVEVRGIENIPTDGGALIVANHSGTIAFDALMTQVAVHDEHPAHRHLRLLGADLVFSTPLLGEVARKGGTTLASNADAERLLTAGELVAVWPEGFKGIGKPFSERYKLQRFGRGGFVSAALKTRAPIVPCAIVGAEEIYPLLGNVRSVARLLGVPYAPITPTWPWLGLLGLIPLPSKWLIEFCPPVSFDEPALSTMAAEDPMTVFDLTDQVRQTIQKTLYSLLVQRRSIFF
jgi:1-acyl-sn-glycerol-3-phosphate acyltransferase